LRSHSARYAHVRRAIGAAAAIAGGYLAVRWQARHATEVAQRIRGEERREDGLFALRAKVNDVSGRIDASYRSVECSPFLSPWPDVYTAAAELRELWQTELSGKIPDKVIVSKYLEFDGRVRDCVPEPYPRLPVRETIQRWPPRHLSRLSAPRSPGWAS